MNCKCKILITLIVLFSCVLKGQDQFAAFEGLVNTSNGEFNMSIPLGSLMSSSGPSQGVGVSYSGNVRMNQPASMAGLGWGFEIGSIKRSVNGIPDDATNDNPVLNGDGVAVDYNTISIPGTGPVITDESHPVVGAIWGGMANASTYSDATYVSSLRGTGQGIVPNFDSFQIVGMGPVGAFSFDSYLEQSDLTNKSIFTEHQIVLYPKPFKDESKSAPETFNPQSVIRDGTTLYPEFSMFPTLIGDPTGNTYIKYYTKNQIASSGGASDRFLVGLVADENFDYYSVSVNGSSILAFTVVLPSGVKYHYSLPVIQFSNTSDMYDLDDGVVQNANGDKVKQIDNQISFISEWKLTAITGPNYKDLNNNRLVDDDDEGYWVKFTYSKWGTYYKRFPYFGLHYNPGASKEELKDLEQKQLNQVGSVSLTNREQYYPETIETDSEFLIFYKDYRKDEYSLSVGNEAIPELRLKRVARYYKNDQAIPSPNESGHPSVPNGFSSSSPETDKTFFSTDFSPLDNRLISSTLLTYDYSLQPQYDGNIDNFHDGGSSSIKGSALIKVIDRKVSLSNSGKLTLLKVGYYDQANQVIDEYDFSYSDLNPNYQVNNHDQNGNYVNMGGLPGLRLRNLNTSQDDISHNWLIDEVVFPNDMKLELIYEEATYGDFLPGVSKSEYFYIPIVNYNSSAYSAELVNDDHKKVFYNTSGIDRRVEVYSNYEKAFSTCNPNPNDIPGWYLYKWYQLKIPKINALGKGVDSQGGLTGKELSYNTSTNVLSIVGGTGNQTSPHYQHNHLSPWQSKEDMYLKFKDDYYRSGISRVKELRIKEDPLSTEYGKLAYAYSQPVRTAKLFESDYFGPRKGVSFLSNYHRYNAIDRGVLYKNVSIKKYDKKGKYISEGIHTFQLQAEFNVATQINSKDPNYCYVPWDWLQNYSPQSFYKFARKNPIIPNRTYQGPFTSYPQTWVDIAPDLLVDAFNYYLQGFYQYNNLNPSDSDLVEQALPSNAFIEMNGVFIAPGDGNVLPALYTGQATCSCEGSVVSTVITIPQGPPYPIRFKSPPIPGTLNSEIYFNTSIERYVGRLGRLEKLEIRDALGNLQIAKNYFYDIKGFKSNTYYAELLNVDASPDVKYKYRTEFRTYYTYPKKIVTQENGQSISENIMDIDLHTGASKQIATITPESFMVGVKTYTNDDPDFNKWSKNSPLLGVKKSVGYENYATRFVSEDIITSEGSELWKDYYEENSKYYLKMNLQNLSTNNIVKHYPPNQNFLSQFYTLESDLPDVDPLREVSIKQYFDNSFEYEILSVSSASGTSSSVSYSSVLKTPLGGDIIVPSRSETSVSTRFSPGANNLKINERQIEIINDRALVLQTYNLQTEVRSSRRYYNSINLPFVEASGLALSCYSATGFEDVDEARNIFEGDFLLTDYQASANTNGGIEPHTGEYYLKLPQTGSYLTIYHDPNLRDFKGGGKYVVSAWIRTAGLSGDPKIKFSIVGEDVTNLPSEAYSVVAESYLSNITDRVDFGDWTLIRMEINVPTNFEVNQSSYTFDQLGGGSVTVDSGLKIEVLNAGGVTLLDDIKFNPASQPVEYLVYDLKFKRVSAKLSGLNHGTKLVYDSRGRVIQSFLEDTQGFFLSKQTNYND